jgi:NhaA family Na+:H+ antiporter
MSTNNISSPSSSSLFKRVISDSRSLGVILLLCTFISLILTNISLTGALYTGFWNSEIPWFHHLHLPHTVTHFINDALMTLFFFHVAIDIKREATVGELSTPKRMMFPAISAVFGVVFPVFIFLLFAGQTNYSDGWAIPAATDIAFSLGILSLLGKVVPHSLKVFLTALAIIDDLCAIVIIALFYGSNLQLQWLLLVLLLGVIIFFVNRHLPNKSGTLIMIALGILMWYAMYQSGIHASIAGVILAFLLPADKMTSFETKLHFPVNFLIIPIFALANTSIIISSAAVTGLGSPLSLGIIMGLLLGKPLGITLAVYMMVKLNIIRMGGIRWAHFIGVGFLAGIGFTMSIFVSNLAFPDNKLFGDIAKLSVLIASGLAMTVGYIWLHTVFKKRPSIQEDIP